MYNSNYSDYVQNQHLDELYIRSLGNTTSIKSNEVFLNSANNGNKRRNLMRIKILYCEVYLPLHIHPEHIQRVHCDELLLNTNGHGTKYKPKLDSIHRVSKARIY